MLKGFQLCSGPVDDVPLDIIRRQQLVDQKPVLFQQFFERSVGKRRFHRRAAKDIALHSGIFFPRHQRSGKMIRENRMFFVFRMKRPSK